MAETKRQRPTYPGRCEFCGGVFAKGSMGRHLPACPKRQLKPGSTSLYQIAVEGQYAPDYWLQVEAPAKVTLYDLDGFLRDIWLECCGHMSAFRIGRTNYLSGGDEFGEFDEDDEDGEGDARYLELSGSLGMKRNARYLPPRERSMDTEIGKALEKGSKFSYEYDFGSTTHLLLRVVAVRDGVAPKKAVTLLARNEPPEIICQACKKAPATEVCPFCMHDSDAWFCKKCAKKHDCGEDSDAFLPVVNSPRVGVCGYTGPVKGRR